MKLDTTEKDRIQQRLEILVKALQQIKNTHHSPTYMIAEQALAESLKLETFQLTAREVAEHDEELIWEYTKRPGSRLAPMSNKVRDLLFETMIEEQKIAGGWFWQLTDGALNGPFETQEAAVEDLRQTLEE